MTQREGAMIQSCLRLKPKEIYCVGSLQSLDLGYNKGPQKWGHEHVMVYPNGRRKVVTVWNGKFRAYSRPVSFLFNLYQKVKKLCRR